MNTKHFLLLGLLVFIYYKFYSSKTTEHLANCNLPFGKQLSFPRTADKAGIFFTTDKTNCNTSREFKEGEPLVCPSGATCIIDTNYDINTNIKKSESVQCNNDECKHNGTYHNVVVEDLYGKEGTIIGTIIDTKKQPATYNIPFCKTARCFITPIINPENVCDNGICYAGKSNIKVKDGTAIKNIKQNRVYKCNNYDCTIIPQ